MKRPPWRWLAGAPLLLLAGHLAAWPVPIEPPAWRAPAAPARTGPFAPNDRLRAVERIGRGEVDEAGRVVEWMEDDSAAPFAPVTSVREHGGFLWLGSLHENALGRIAAPPFR